MALMAVLEADLRALSMEARRKYPAVKEAAEHAILKLRSIPDPTLLAQSDDIVRIFIMACECKNVKLSITGLACLQKWIAHGAVPLSALPEILATLKEHADISDETVQLKTLQAILTIFQSQLHPEDEDNMAIALGICFRLLENNKNPDSVHSTAAATVRQAVALIFDRVVAAEGLPINSAAPSRRTSRSNSVSGDVSRSIIAAKTVELAKELEPSVATKEQMTQAARLGLRLFEDLTAVATGGPASWLRVPLLQRTFSLDMIEYVLSNYVSIFRKLGPYQLVLRHQVCSLLMTSLRTTGELEGEVGEPSFRRLVLRCVANVLRLYSSILVTECEVFLNMLLKSVNLELPLWHRIMVLEVLRGFCVEARILRLLFQTFDMRPENTNVVAGMVRVLANVVTNVQVPDASEESLAAVAGMFNSKAKGLEWSMDYDASGVTVVVASEAHAISLAVEGLLGVVFTVATLTDEAIDAGELNSPRCETNQARAGPETSNLALLCVSIVNSVWKILLEALSLILSRSQGEAIVLEILKGYQAFTQACGVLRAIEPLNAFLASLCKFALVPQNDLEKSSVALVSPSGKRPDVTPEFKDVVVLTPKNVQALRTIFNIAHRLDSVLGSSWTLVLETLALLDRVIHSPHATTQEVSAVVPRFSRDLSTQSSDFNILSTLDSQLFESSAFMSTSAVSSLLTALRQVSNESLIGVTSGFGQTVSGVTPNVASSVGGTIQPTMPKMFAVERMVATLVNNLHRAELFWDQIVAHLLELAEHESSQVRSVSLDALDRAICAVLGCERIKKQASDLHDPSIEEAEINTVAKGERRQVFNSDTFECKVILPIRTLYSFGQNTEARSGALKILLHVLERHGEKLYHSWPDILELLRSVANTSEKDFVPLGFQCVCVIMNDSLMSIPSHALDTCIEVAGAFGAQRTDVNISLTAIGLLWTTSDFFARGLSEGKNIAEVGRRFSAGALHLKLQHHINDLDTGLTETDVPMEDLTASPDKRIDVDYKRLLLAVHDVIQGFGTDERPEVRNTAIDTLFMSISRHGHKLSPPMLEHCLWNLVFPLIDTVRHLASTSSADEWQGRELGTQGGKPVHMLVHHSRNTAQKQWDETLVFVLNGVRRLLKHLFVLLQSLKNFRQGWDCLFDFIKKSILNSSKEVAFAAITTLHVVVTTHSSKGSMPRDYFEVAFSTYEGAIIGTVHTQSRVVYKARQELLRNAVELYKQAYLMFEPDMYRRLLFCINALARSPLNASDKPYSSQDNMPLVQRTVLEVIPMLKPLDDHMISVWPDFLRLMVEFLVIGDNVSAMQGKNANNSTAKGMKGEVTENGHGIGEVMEKRMSQTMAEQHGGSLSNTKEYFNKLLNLTESIRSDTQASETTSTEYFMDLTFIESVVTILQTHYIMAPSPSRLQVLPDVVGGLGRCMCTRRDAPFGNLWRTATTAFNTILLEDIVLVSMLERPCKGQTDKLSSGPGRPRFWKEVADVYEAFLVGSCGRAVTVSTESCSDDHMKVDELLEQNVLEVLCNTVLKTCQAAPSEVITKLVHVIDRCASRTSMLPLGSVELLPAHCSRFSFICLQALFSISRFDSCDEASSSFIVGKIAMPVLVARCDFILKQFSRDENDQGDISLPTIRIEELTLVLKELARLTTPGGDFLEGKLSVGAKTVAGRRIHLVMLYGSLCQLVITREIRIRELLLVLLRLLGSELNFLENA
ncbi:hypothetical protein GOP47_0024602 [Adiantum capillus-veneris]|uniref:Protein MON2 homolog n=1 Tax=Adiantum capillus-veneris TaxID=13818 RepID=A0A9D4U2K1_ADICA|nr:hypothetical protein GOP47_0024602 [Adiantum capillus-veneris]